MRFSEITLQLLAYRGLALLIVAAVHGVALAGLAALLGDRGPRQDGRLTPWPGGHLDPLGSVCALLFGLGWIRPLAVEPRRLWAGRLGALVVVLGGAAALLALALAFDALVRPALTTLPHTMALTAAAFLRLARGMSIWFALLGLIPLPPLAGGLLLEALGLRLPPLAQRALPWLLFATVVTGTVTHYLQPAQRWLSTLVLGA